MEARIAGETALRAAAHHRRVSHATESRLTPEQKALMDTLPPELVRVLMERGAARALQKYGNAVLLRCDAADTALFPDTEATPVRPLRFLRG